MANLNLSCPSCGQNMVCDDAYAGQQVSCPACHQALTVPGQSASANAGNPLTPRPPAEGKSKLAIGTAQTHGKGAAAQPSHPSNLSAHKTGRGPKKKSPIMEYVTYLLIAAILGGAGYYTYVTFYKKPAEEVATPSGKPSQPKTAADGGAAAAEAAADPNAAPPAAEPPPAKPIPMVAPVWTQNLKSVKISDGPVNGKITGTNFIAEAVRVDLTAQSQVLRFIQGSPTSPDRELLVYLKLKPTDVLGGQTLEISNEMRGAGVPQVAKRWKTNPKYAPQMKSFSSGYAMKLELGSPTNEAIAGKIFVALPDNEQTVVAGSFKLTVLSVEAAQAAASAAAAAVQATPVQPALSPAEKANFERRYGVKR
jgi:hypothetical protein